MIKQASDAIKSSFLEKNKNSTVLGFVKSNSKPSTIIKAIRAQLGPHLLKYPYKERRPNGATKSWGCCYVATEALYHLWGKANGYSPMCVPFRIEGHAFGNHWFLEQRPSGFQVDITADQFDGVFWGDKPDYQSARPRGFMTKQPSKRAQQVINGVLKKHPL